MTLQKHECRLSMKALRQQAFKTNPLASIELIEHARLLLKGAKRVGGYYPMGYEISPLPLMKALADQGIGLALPLASNGGQPLEFCAWAFNDPLYKTSLGFKEPACRTTVVQPDTLLVPLLAFDNENFRLGYGRGDYDRTIRHLKNQQSLITLGLAFETQRLDYIPREPHDEPLDYIVTPKGSYARVF